MKKSSKILVVVGLAAIAAGLIVYSVRRQRTNQRYARIADEGYETAHDILFPAAKQKRKKVHYGPVLPE